MRVIVTGTRDYGSGQLVGRMLDMVMRSTDEGLTVIENGDDGVDAAAREWVSQQQAAGGDVAGQTVPWDPDDAPIGARCSAIMVGSGADLVLAFPRGPSPGTRHCVDLARQAGLPVHLFELSPSPGGADRMTVIAGGAAPIRDVGLYTGLAQLLGHQVDLIATPSGRGFLTEHEVAKLADQTRYDVRSRYTFPHDEDAPTRVPTGPPDVVVAAPATANTLVKLSLGVADTLALSVLGEAIGAGTPVIVAPFMNADQHRYPPVRQAVEALSRSGVHVIERDSHPPRTGGSAARRYGWLPILAAAHAASRTEE